jgi:hypothetical protein
MVFLRWSGSLAALFILAGQPAGAGDGSPSVDARRGDWFRSLMQPGKPDVSCCDISDCKRTVAEWKDGRWWADVRGKWRPIPAESVLVTPRSIDGDAYVCSAEEARADRHFIEPRIYCFIPPDIGS